MTRPTIADAVSAAVRSDFTTFVRKAFGTLNPGVEFEPGWHIEAMTHAISQVWREDTSRLLITIPPRHLKSICAAVAFPAWAIGHDPSLRFQVISYASDLAIKHARDFRSVMEAPWYRHAFPHIGKFIRNTETELITAQNGGRRALSLGGSVTGFGADFIIIDDLMKAADAAYPIERQRVKDAYQATIIPRLEDKRVGKVIVIQQRLHEDDLAGFLIESGQFTHLNLPAIAEEDGEFFLGRGRVHHRRKGEALSTREPIEALEALRLEMGSSAFAAQYQQNPAAPDGNVVRWEKFVTYDEAPSRSACQLVVQSWDTGITISTTSSFSVCTTWGLHDRVWLLLDVVRVRMEFPDLLGLVGVLREKWSADIILIEQAASGQQLLQALSAELRSRPLVRRRRDERRGWNVLGWRPSTDKMTRLAAQGAKLEAGFARFPREAPWLEDLKREMTACPNGRFDDQVDSISQFLEFTDTLRPRRERSSIRI